MSEDSPTAGPLVAKTPMTDEERLALCAKLDGELEDFIDGLEKTKYTDGWPEDRWEEVNNKTKIMVKFVPDEIEMVSFLLGIARKWISIRSS